MLNVARFVVALAFILLSPLNAAARWTELRSEHFLFIGDAPESVIRATAQKLERFREVLVLAIPGATMTSPAQTIVLVFNDDRSFSPYKPLFVGRPVDVAGLFVRSEDINYIAINAGAVEPAFKIVFHEYSHFLLWNWVGEAVPVWLSEGLAEVYATFEERAGGRGAVLGAPDAEHLRLLQNTSLIPLRDLIAIDQRSPVYNEGERRGVLYAESWALVHYLMYGNKTRTPQLSAFLAAIKSGAPAEMSFRTAFGDLDVLDRELREYIRLFTFPSVQLNFAERLGGAPSQRGTVIPDAEASAYLGDLLVRLDRIEDARAHLTALLGTSPDVARAACAMGLLELHSGRYDLAMPLLERGAALAPDDPWVQTALARALIARFEEPLAPDDAAAQLPRARAALARALEGDPDSAYTLVTLGRAHMLPGGDLDRASALLLRAVQLAPGREDYRLVLAHAYIRQGDRVRATAQLEALAAGGSRADVRDQAREMLGDMVIQNATPDAGNPGVATASNARAANPSTTGTGAGLSRAGRSQPDLRLVGPGETRVRGIFRSVDCRPGSVVLVIDQDGRNLRLSAGKLDDVEFVSYRQNAPDGVQCGPQPQAMPVLATFRAVELSSASVDGRAVAIEMIEDDYLPR